MSRYDVVMGSIFFRLDQKSRNVFGINLFDQAADRRQCAVGGVVCFKSNGSNLFTSLTFRLIF